MSRIAPHTGTIPPHLRGKGEGRKAACMLLAALFCGAPAFHASAQSHDATVAEATAYAPGTGDAWLDRQLADINRHADRYPDAFVDELVRYGGAQRGYVQALMQQHGWAAGDVWFACFWGKATGLTCREPVRAHAQHPGEGWKAVVQTLPVVPENLHWRALRHALVASYDHWDRPIRLDPLLQRQLGDRARRDTAARRD